MSNASRDDLPRRAEVVTGRAVLVLLGVVLVLTVLLVLVRPHDANVDYLQWWVVASLLATVAGAVGVTVVARRAGSERAQVPGRRTRDPRLVWSAAVGTSALGGAVAVLAALPLRYAYGWDASVVTGFSRQLSSDGTLSAYAHDYLSRYPNNVPLVAMMNVARWLGGPADADMYLAYIVANGLCLAAVLLITFALVRSLRGTAAAFIAQGVVLVLVGGSPWMAVPYTDFPSMPFVIGSVALAVAGTRTTRPGVRVGTFAGAFALAGVAYVIKSTPASVAVALGLVIVVMALGRSWRGLARAGAACLAGAAVFAVTVVGGQAVADATAHVSRTGLDARSAPVAWWLANGLTTTKSISGRPYYGGYNPQMVNESMHLSGEPLQTWSERRLTQQLGSLGPVGVVAFEVRKQAFNWGDGMFFAWGEGYDFQARRLLEHDAVATSIQSFQHPSGRWFRLRASLTNGLWLGLLLWAGVGLVRGRYRREVLVLALTVLGILAFTLLFQGRSRYVFAYVPVVVALAAVTDPTRLWRAPWLRRPRDREPLPGA